MMLAKLMAVLALVVTSAALSAEPDDVIGGRRTGDEEADSGQRTADSERIRNADVPPAQSPEPSAQEPSSASSPSAVRRPPVTSTRSADRLELDTTVVTGNRELPKVLYIVPWKKADIGDLPGQPFNTLLDEVLEPVDRDVFRREVTYFDAVTGGADATQSTSADPR